MFYIWFIPVAICAALVVFGLYLQLRGRTGRISDSERKSPLDLAKELEALEDAAKEREEQEQVEREKRAA